MNQKSYVVKQPSRDLVFEIPAALEFFTAADAAKEITCCPASVKRVARELKLVVVRTRGGYNLFTQPQIEKIRAELERRRIEGHQ